jgi:hypothetical protein
MMNFWLGTYEREKMAALAAELRPEMVVYDIGSNVGATPFSLPLAAAKFTRLSLTLRI